MERSFERIMAAVFSVGFVFACFMPVQAQQANSSTQSTETVTVSTQTMERLEQHLADLESEVQQLKVQMQDMQSTISASEPAVAPSTDGRTHSLADSVAQSASPSQTNGLLSADDRNVLDYFKGTTINVLVDGYYAYNFNNPVGRVNLLRAYDVSSNAFSLNQAAVVFDRPPDVSEGRRFGARLDLQFGQATDTLQGNPANEPRPDVYRNIFQAFGTYVVPVGSGLTIDVGKWASSLGIEGNYTKDQINYSRSYWFYFLPFYHEGVRANFPINHKIAINYWLVNGTNQTEPTNGFKDELFGLAITPNKNISWTVNYYYGQDHPDAMQVPTCGPVPVQPGLCFRKISPAPNGKTHIFDSYVTWQSTPKLTLALEGDYFIQRLWASSAPGRSSAPSDVWGSAAYAKYQLTPRTYVGGRTEYLQDHGGLFTGITNYTEALKEVTATYDFRLADGFDMRWEYRRDISNRPIFLTDQQNVFSTHQDTATMGVIWWFGRKQGAW
jgi:hypothetical protein